MLRDLIFMCLKLLDLKPVGTWNSNQTADSAYFPHERGMFYIFSSVNMKTCIYVCVHCLASPFSLLMKAYQTKAKWLWNWEFHFRIAKRSTQTVLLKNTSQSMNKQNARKMFSRFISLVIVTFQPIVPKFWSSITCKEYIFIWSAFMDFSWNDANIRIPFR